MIEALKNGVDQHGDNLRSMSKLSPILIVFLRQLG